MLDKYPIRILGTVPSLAGQSGKDGSLFRLCTPFHHSKRAASPISDLVLPRFLLTCINKDTHLCVATLQEFISIGSAA